MQTSTNGIEFLVLTAYKLASDASAALGDGLGAYQYLKKYVELEETHDNDIVKRQLALQKAKFEIAQQDSRIDFLDQQNQLLQTQAKLAGEQVQNSILALALATLTLAALLIWIWRSYRTQRALKKLAQIDSLTGVGNRGHFTVQVESILLKARDKRLPVSIMLLDLDYFKRVNDSFGHQTGDWALKSAVRSLRQTLGKDAIIGRMGGEEFAVVFPEMDAGQALKIAERCRQAIENIDTQPTGQRFLITASFGVSDSLQSGFDIDTVMSAADLALYQSKREGRNRVCIYTIEMAGGQAVN